MNIQELAYHASPFASYLSVVGVVTVESYLHGICIHDSERKPSSNHISMVVLAWKKAIPVNTTMLAIEKDFVHSYCNL